MVGVMDGVGVSVGVGVGVAVIVGVTVEEPLKTILGALSLVSVTEKLPVVS